MKIALVHDDFIQEGGAEKLFEAIASIWPEAPVYTSLVDFSKTSIPEARFRTSFMQKIPFAKNFYRFLLPLYPIAFESFDFKDFDLVISSTTRFAKSIITKPSTIHISYVNSVPRFLWHEKSKEHYLSPFLQKFTKPYFDWLKRWDKVSSSRVDYYIANSSNVQNSIKKIYKRNSEVIYPFADTDFYKPSNNKPQNYYLIVTRLLKWKRVDIAIKAAGKLNLSLIIVGSGPDEKRLKSMTTEDKIKFVGNVPKVELKSLIQNCRALIVTQEEDFGISIVEALACARPVIAYKKGGQQEIITDNSSGIFFEKQTPESLEDAIITASKVKWDINQLRKEALKFTKYVFVKKLEKKVKEYAPKPQ